MADKIRRTYADLLGKDPVPLLPDGACVFCGSVYKENSRIDAPTIHGGVRRFTTSKDRGLACDDCITKRGDSTLPSMRKHVELETAWAADARAEGSS